MRFKLMALLFISLMFNSLYAQQVHSDVYHPCAHTKSQQSIAMPENVHPLMQDYDVEFYFLDLNVMSIATTVSGNVLMRASSKVTMLDTIMLDLMSYMSVDSVVVNGSIHTFSHSNDLITIPVSGIAMGSSFEVQTYYHGTPPSSGFFTGISTSYNSTYGKSVTWTLSEPFNARHWWPCKQDLQDKADSSWFFITCDDDEMAGSNGLLSSVVNLSGNKKRYEWKSRYPIAYYLISFAVSDYQEYNIYAHPQGLNDSILIQNFVYDHPSYLPANQAGIDATAGMIETFSNLMGMYPFHEEKYGHCVAQIGGGMEHQTMTTLYGFGFDLVAHELGHMWYGDNVTCATWSDIWINEGFASYSEYLARQYLQGQSSAQSWMYQVNTNVMSSPGGSVYVPPMQAVPGNEWRIFNGRLSYNKGASIIHMIRFELQNDSLFFAILSGFQDAYRDSVATGDDFRDYVTTQSGRDFTWFFDQWYYGEGYPSHSVVYQQEADSLHFIVTQGASMPSVTPFFEMLMEYRVVTDQGDTLIRVYQEYPVQIFSVPVKGNVLNMYIDPNEWTLDMPGSVVVGRTEEQDRLTFQLYPNPASIDHIRLQLDYLPRQACQYHLLDMAGRQVLEGSFSGIETSLDIRRLEKGTYILHLSDGVRQSGRKLIRL